MTSTRELANSYLRKFKLSLFTSGTGARLPCAYKKFYYEWRRTPRKPVNYIAYTGKPWVRNEETGEVKRVVNVPLPGRYPPELHNVFTGGETVIQGFKKKTDRKHKYNSRVPHFWMPVLYRSVVYSEILDKYFSAPMTKRVVELIHYHEGFDNYLLQNKACDLLNLVALKLKQRILLALSNKDLPYDENKNNEIYNKYEKYLIPPEEIEWYGLTFGEACNKLKNMEEAQKEASIIPFKHKFRAQLIEELKRKQEEGEEKEKNQDIMKKSLHWLTEKIPRVSKFTKDKP